MVSTAAIFAAGLAALTAVIAVLPTTAFDAVAAHLPLARSYLASHSLHPPEALQYGWYPQGFEILASFAWFFGGQAGAQILAACVLRPCGPAPPRDREPVRPLADGGGDRRVPRCLDSAGSLDGQRAEERPADVGVAAGLAV